MINIGKAMSKYTASQKSFLVSELVFSSPVVKQWALMILWTLLIVLQSRKRKEIAQVEPPKEVEKEKELKLMCAICLDSMKMESSTVCGHIFCQSCIRGAISAQKKCPTCRRKLAMKDVHRIYIQSGVK
jgi:hypothetical protein